MKKLFFLPLLALYLHSDDSKISSVSEYKIMFEKIGQKRVGLDNSKIDRIESPFIKVVKKEDVNETKVDSGSILQGIINKRAKINGHWYGIGDMVGNMKVISIRKKEVILQENKITKRLTMRRKDAKISIK